MEIVKFFWSLIINLDLIIITILAFCTLGLCCARTSHTCPKKRSIAAISAILLFFMLGDWPYSGRDILRRFEEYYQVIEVPQDTFGIVITGGSLCLPETEARGSAVYHKTAGRLLEALKVAHTHPHTQIIFAGSKTESEEFLKLATALNVASQRIKVVDNPLIHHLEDAAVEAVKLAGDTKTQKWLLITSAFTMPRTISIFKANGWELTPFPVDFHTTGHSSDKKQLPFLVRITASFQDRLGLLAWNCAWREIAGLSNLYISGKTNTFIPKIDAVKK